MLRCAAPFLITVVPFNDVIHEFWERPSVDSGVNNEVRSASAYSKEARGDVRAVWVFGTAREDECQRRNNYMSKMWYYVRCIVLREVNVRVASNAQQALGMARFGDAVLIFSRWSDTMRGYSLFDMVRGSVSPAVRFGVMHVVDELRKAVNASWYAELDFTLCKYWSLVRDVNVLYVPLGGQMPDT